MFTNSFQKYAYIGDTIETESDGFDISARIVYDDDYRIDDDDCHNPDQAITGCNDEQFAKLLAARKAWSNDEWFYCGVVLSVSRNGIMLGDHAASLWGIECNYPDTDNNYLAEVANDLLPEAVDFGNAQMQRLIGETA